MNSTCNGNCCQGRACECDEGASHLTTAEVALFVGVIAAATGVVVASVALIVRAIGGVL